MLIDDEDIQAIRERTNAATVGPWVDMTETYRKAMATYHKRTKKWWHGSRKWCLPVVAVVSAITTRGERIEEGDIPYYVDWWDFRHVMSWRWGVLSRSTSSISEGFLKPQDAAFIAHSRQDVVDLLDTLEIYKEYADALDEAYPALFDMLGPAHPATSLVRDKLETLDKRYSEKRLRLLREASNCVLCGAGEDTLRTCHCHYAAPMHNGACVCPDDTRGTPHD